MADAEIAAWARTFAAELKVAGEPGFIDRVIGKHLTTLSALKEADPEAYPELAAAEE
jgi:hypothetical protein